VILSCLRADADTRSEVKEDNGKHPPE
jgi:hypothetical protein